MARRFYPVLLFLILCACEQTQRPAPVISYAQLQGAGSTGIHTIQRGDSVGAIAGRYKLDIRDIIVINALQAPYKLQPGQRLKLPAPRTYRTRQNDTLYSVAHMFNTSASQLVRLNNLAPPYALRGGEVLKLPVLEDAPVATASAVPTTSWTPAISMTAPGARIERESLSAPTPQIAGQVSAPAVAAPAPRLAQTALSEKVPDATPPRSGGKFMMPVAGPILSRYGPKADGRHNDGINIKGPKGAPVRAAENGVVVYVGSTLKGYGNMVLIRHADRWMTAYAHMDKTLVKKGAVVKRGDAIGTVGSTGSVDQPQLHFEIRRGIDALNPEKFV